jgi:general secretion pathway protein D
MQAGRYSEKQNNKKRLFGILAVLCALLTACTNFPRAMAPAEQHLKPADTDTHGDIPPLAENAPLPPPPKKTKPAERYSVVVNNVSAQEILFALARDARLNIEIHPGITGAVTMNLIERTLPEIMDAISRQVDMRYEIKGDNLAILPDKPFLRTYKIDFINMSRTVENKNITSTQITGAAANSVASTSVSSTTKNELMESLIQNVKDMIIEEDKLHYLEQIDLQTKQQAHAKGAGVASNSVSLSSPSEKSGKSGKQSGSRTGGAVSGSGDQDVQGQGEFVAKKADFERAVNVFANKESGILLVRATSRQHGKVQEFIDKVMVTAKRQVVIEATIVEVTLSDNYKQGINWSLLQRNGSGFQLTQAGTAGLPSANPANMFVLNYLNPLSRLGNLNASVSLLESFGKIKVLSSPKLSVMNNQTATLKVVNNMVYFTITSTAATYSATGTILTQPTYTTIPNTVSVGFIMSVTPQISDSDTVTINLRPTITRILDYVNDPNPDLAKAGVTNRIPELQTREIESIIKVDNGQIAIMGGLMQDSINNFTDELPGLGRIPGIGEFFKNRNDTTIKTELVIFLRPIVLNQENQYDVLRQFKNPTESDEWQKASQKAEVTP